MSDLDRIKSRDEAERRVRIWIDAHATAMERDLTMSGSTYFSPAEVQQMGPGMAQEIDALVPAVNRVDDEDEVLPKIAAVLAGRDPEARSDLRAVVDEICDEIGLRADLAGPNGPIVERVVLRGYAELIKRRIALEFGEIAPIPETSRQSPPAQRSPAAAASIDRPTTPLPLTTEPSFFAHWEAFVANKLRIEEWGADMPANAAVARTVFTALKGSLTPSALTKKIASEFRDALFELPRLYDKDRRWRDLPLAEVAAAVAEYRKRDPNFNVMLISKTTVNKHLTNLSTYWSWCNANGRIPETLKNPFLKLASKRARGKSAREARPQWPEELEKALFTSPVWTGCQSLHRRTKAGASIFRDALFWVPLLCRTFGARSDEICSRKVGDIKFATDGIAYLEIRDQGIDEFRRALAFDPNLATAHGLMGLAKIYVGHPEETGAHESEALRLSPRDSFAWLWLHFAGAARMTLGAEEEAVALFRRSIENNRTIPLTHFFLAATLANLGKLEEARTEAKAGLALDPGFSIGRFRRAGQTDERLEEGMRKAGVPEG